MKRAGNQSRNAAPEGTKQAVRHDLIGEHLSDDRAEPVGVEVAEHPDVGAEAEDGARFEPDDSLVEERLERTKRIAVLEHGVAPTHGAELGARVDPDRDVRVLARAELFTENTHFVYVGRREGFVSADQEPD